jgi:hypothetical protein
MPLNARNPMDSYTAVGNVDDMSNVITNIAPSETPLMSGFGRSKAIGVMHSWLEDDIRDPKDNAVAEGAEFVTQAAQPRVLRYNVTQILSSGYEVTGTQEVVAKHGVKSELGYQMQKAAKELALDYEYAIINNGAMNEATNVGFGGRSGTPANPMTRRFKGIKEFITMNEVDATDAALMDPGATAGDFTEGLLNAAIQFAWECGGQPKRAYMSAANKRIASNFQFEKRGVKKTQDEIKLKNVIRFYESDFGVIEFYPHRFLQNDTILIIDPQYVKMADLRPVHKEVKPKTADAVNGVLLGETTLEVRADGAHAKVTNLNTTALRATRPTIRDAGYDQNVPIA